MFNNLKSKKVGGYYKKDDQLFLSTTMILGIIDKPALRWWFGQQVFLAMVKDPNLSQEDALKAPYRTSEGARERGKTVHSIVEAYKRGTTISSEQVPEQFKGYVRAFYTAVGHLRLNIKEQEKTVFSHTYKYAGTLDMVANIDGLSYVIDVKTGNDIYAEAFMQTASYRMALAENGVQTVGTAVLLLKEDGRYKFEVCDQEADLRIQEDGFLACKKLYTAKYLKDLKKIGYL